MKCKICNKGIGKKETRHYITVGKHKEYACSQCCDKPAWDYHVDLQGILRECAPLKKGSLRAYLVPELVRLGARLLESHENVTFGCIHETWEIDTGAGRLEIYPQDAYRSAVPDSRGRRGRVGAHIHSRFDDVESYKQWAGIPAAKHDTGKFNWYHFDFQNPDDLGPRFIAMLVGVKNWEPCEQLKAI